MQIEEAKASIWTDADGISELQLILDGEKEVSKTLGDIGLEPLSGKTVSRTEVEAV